MFEVLWGIPWVHSQPWPSGRSTGWRTTPRPPFLPPVLRSYRKTFMNHTSYTRDDRKKAFGFASISCGSGSGSSVCNICGSGSSAYFFLISFLLKRKKEIITLDLVQNEDSDPGTKCGSGSVSETMMESMRLSTYSSVVSEFCSLFSLVKFEARPFNFVNLPYPHLCKLS